MEGDIDMSKLHDYFAKKLSGTECKHEMITNSERKVQDKI